MESAEVALQQECAALRAIYGAHCFKAGRVRMATAAAPLVVPAVRLYIAAPMQDGWQECVHDSLIQDAVDDDAVMDDDGRGWQQPRLGHVAVICYLPADYPATGGIRVQLVGLHQWLCQDGDRDKNHMATEGEQRLQRQCDDVAAQLAVGQPVLFDLLEEVKSRLHNHWERWHRGRSEEDDDDEDAAERDVEEGDVDDQDHGEDGNGGQDDAAGTGLDALAIQSPAVKVPRICQLDEPIVDRKSAFVGHCAAVHSLAEVEAVLTELCSRPRIRRATHPAIHAYRIQIPASTPGGRDATLQDYDDCGEQAAGKRLLHLLRVLHCYNVVVVVTRWYGGVGLGPDRFKHINNAARAALIQHGGFLATATDSIASLSPSSAVGGGGGKRVGKHAKSKP